MSFNTKKQAEAKRTEVLAILGDGWIGEVWDNLGWHCAWRHGSVSVHYSTYGNSYSVLMGSPGSGTGHMDFSGDHTSCEDPRKAVRKACDHALKIIEQEWWPIQASITKVRSCLDN